MDATTNEYLVIDGIEFGQDDAVDTLRAVGIWVVGESLIEFHQLIDSFVAHQRFTNEQNQIGFVHFDQL